MTGENWTEKYKKKIMTAPKAIGKIRRGARIYLGTGCGVPYHLVQELANNATQMVDNEIVHLLTLGDTPSADPKFQSQFRHNTLFVSENIREAAQTKPAKPIIPKTVFLCIKSDKSLKTAVVEAGKVLTKSIVTAAKACSDECRMNPAAEMKTKNSGMKERIA